jgi:raffinose synthase
VYVSDAPGKHDFTLLRKLVFPSGRVLRGSLPGRPTRDCVFKDPCSDKTTALKIWNKNARNDCGVVGAFNVQGASWSRAKGIFVERFDDAAEFVVAEVSPSDVETLRSSTKGDALPQARSSSSTSFPPLFAVHAHRSGETRALGTKDVWRVKLRPKQWEIYAVARVRRTREETTNRDSTLKNLQWAFIGLTGMLNGGGAVLSDSHRVEREANKSVLSSSAARGKRLTNARRVCVVAFATVYGCGSLAAFATARPRSVLVDGEPVAFRFDRDATGATGEVCGGRVLVPLGPREDTHEVQMRFEA